MPDDDDEHDDDARPIDAPLAFAASTGGRWNEDSIHGGADDAQD
jgi:hypothetical protein